MRRSPAQVRRPRRTARPRPDTRPRDATGVCSTAGARRKLRRRRRIGAISGRRPARAGPAGPEPRRRRRRRRRAGRSDGRAGPISLARRRSKGPCGGREVSAPKTRNRADPRGGGSTFAGCLRSPPPHRREAWRDLLGELQEGEGTRRGSRPRSWRVAPSRRARRRPAVRACAGCRRGADLAEVVHRTGLPQARRLARRPGASARPPRACAMRLMCSRCRVLPSPLQAGGDLSWVLQLAAARARAARALRCRGERGRAAPANSLGDHGRDRARQSARTAG